MLAFSWSLSVPNTTHILCLDVCCWLCERRPLAQCLCVSFVALAFPTRGREKQQRHDARKKDKIKGKADEEERTRQEKEEEEHKHSSGHRSLFVVGSLVGSYSSNYSTFH